MSDVPFATRADYLTTRDLPEGVTSARLDVLLAEASELMREEALANGRDLDGMIEAGNLTDATTRKVAIEIVAEALKRRAVNAPAGATAQMTTGPFSESITVPQSLPDDMYLTRAMRRRLRLGARAGRVKMYEVPQ